MTGDWQVRQVIAGAEASAPGSRMPSRCEAGLARDGDTGTGKKGPLLGAPTKQKKKAATATAAIESLLRDEFLGAFAIKKVSSVSQ